MERSGVARCSSSSCALLEDDDDEEGAGCKEVVRGGSCSVSEVGVGSGGVSIDVGEVVGDGNETEAVGSLEEDLMLVRLALLLCRHGELGRL